MSPREVAARLRRRNFNKLDNEAALAIERMLFALATIAQRDRYATREGADAGIGQYADISLEAIGP